MTNSADEKILDRLAKLKAHAESAEKIGSVEEAEAFASMLSRLLLKHKLELTDLQVAAAERDEPVSEFDIDYSRYPDVDVKKVRIEWIERLAGIIARAHFCRILIHRDSSRLSLVGRKSDVEICEYMIITLQRATLSLAKKEHSKYAWECYKRSKSTVEARGFKRAFINAFIARIQQRFDEARREAAGTSSTALVRFDRATAAVTDFMNGRYRMSRGLRKQHADHIEGATRGRAAADQINLRANAVNPPQQAGWTPTLRGGSDAGNRVGRTGNRVDGP